MSPCVSRFGRGAGVLLAPAVFAAAVHASASGAAHASAEKTESGRSIMQAAFGKLVNLLPPEAVLAADALEAADEALDGTWTDRDAAVLPVALTATLVAQETLDRRPYGVDGLDPLLGEKSLPLSVAHEQFLHARLAHAVYAGNAKGVAAACHLASDDILQPPRRPACDSLAPAYCLGVDHVRRQIVLAVRGTASIQDIITDACGVPAHLTWSRGDKEVASHAVHSGVARAAAAILIDSAKGIVCARKDYPDYAVVLTGHSLGGGAAALLAWMVNGPSASAEPALSLPAASSSRVHHTLSSIAAEASAAQPAAGHPGPVQALKGWVSGLVGRRSSSEAKAGDDAAKSKPKTSTVTWQGKQLLEARQQWREALGGQALSATVFCAPACVEAPLAQAMAPTVTCVVNGHDIVPRMHLTALELLRRDMARLEWHEDMRAVLPLLLEELGPLRPVLESAVAALGRGSGAEGGERAPEDDLQATVRRLESHLREWAEAVRASQPGDSPMLAAARAFTPPGTVQHVVYPSEAARTPEEALAEEEGEEGGSSKWRVAPALRAWLSPPSEAKNSGDEPAPEPGAPAPFSLGRLFAQAATVPEGLALSEDSKSTLDGLLARLRQVGKQEDDDKPKLVGTPKPTIPWPAGAPAGPEGAVQRLVISKHMLSDHRIEVVMAALARAAGHAQRKQ